tara:strand:- start:111 stop:788 length:678 start_codon:yes stop_codon:yes gene_type:complete
MAQTKNPNRGTGNADIIITTFYPKTKRNFFPATITDYSDSFSSQWDEQAAYGFQDNVAILQGTTRMIRVSFVIGNTDVTESIKYMKRLNRIVQNLYPAYNSSTGQPQGTPLFGLKIMNWTQNKSLMGYVKNFTISPDLSEGAFIQFRTGKMYPKIIPVTFEMTVIHDKRPGTIGETFELGADFPVGLSPLEAANIVDVMNVNNLSVPEGQATTNLAQKLLKSLDE